MVYYQIFVIDFCRLTLYSKGNTFYSPTIYCFMVEFSGIRSNYFTKEVKSQDKNIFHFSKYSTFALLTIIKTPGLI